MPSTDASALRIEPLAAPPQATVRLPGSKSITNRALVRAALVEGRSVLEGALVADDTEAMVACLRALGVGVAIDSGRFVVDGIGGVLPGGPLTLDARMSGTTARFLLPVLALGPGPYRLDGAPQLRSRPMADGIAAVRALGASVEEEGEPGHLPVVVRGPVRQGAAVTVSGEASSQFLSGLLLAGFEASVDGSLVSAPYVVLTRTVVDAFAGGAATYAVEPDASAASYFFAAAAITGGEVRVDGLGRRSVQGDVAFVDVLARMGAEVDQDDESTTVRGTGVLHGVGVDLTHISDTAPTLAAVAAFADSPTRATGIGFIRRKESDRIAAVVTELRRCGVEAEEEPDGFVVRPSPGGGVHGARIETYDDHRMAMAFALLGLRIDGIEIVDPDCVAKTFPGYWQALDSLRARPAR